MFQKEKKSILLLLFSSLFVQFSFGQENISQRDREMLDNGIRILRNYFFVDNNWHMAQPGVSRNVRGLINFVEAAPIDTIIGKLKQAHSEDSVFVYRLPENVEDSLSVPGYVSAEAVAGNVLKIGADYREEVRRNPINVPEWVISDARKAAPVVEEGKGYVLFADSVYSFPPELIIPEVIPDSVLNSPEQFRQLVRIDSLRNVFVEQKRLAYNDSLTNAYVAQRSADYQKQMFDEQLRFRVKNYRDQTALSNYQVLKDYNRQVMAEVNDTIGYLIDFLSAYADYIDTATISMTNLKGDSSEILLQKGHERFARVWLKNEQNDSLQMLVKTTGKRGMQLLINDGVTFTRFQARETKGFDFETLRPADRFSKVGKSYELQTPWVIGGDGNAGFTQTYFENWKKGGESALSLLMVLKGFANYNSADGKKKWENNAEIRNGWMKPGNGAETRKNDDKFELTSRFGLSAYKKWFYSTELYFNTQFFRGYKYPKKNNPNPISSFLAPSKTVFKIGMDYKPSNNFSLLLSPLSLKNVYVRDTALIDQTKFGVAADRKAFWEVGLNADLRMKHQFTPDISLETKYKMFINYRDPLKKLDMDLENQLRIKLNTFMDMRLMIHLLYDDNVLFPVYNDAGDKVGEKAKLQVEEFFTIGFTYKINKKVMRTKKLR